MGAAGNFYCCYKGETITSADTDYQEAIKTVHELIKDIDNAMLTTVSEEGLVSRLMKTQDVEFEGNLWFLTKKDSGKFHELLRNQHVNVACASNLNMTHVIDSMNFEGVSLFED